MNCMVKKSKKRQPNGLCSEIATILGTSPNYVTQVLGGHRSSNKGVGLKIVQAKELIESQRLAIKNSFNDSSASL